MVERSASGRGDAGLARARVKRAEGMILRGCGGTVVRFSAAESMQTEWARVSVVCMVRDGARSTGDCVCDTRYLVVLRTVAVDRLHPPPR